MEYFIRRDNYERHLETAKHKKYFKSKPKVSIDVTYDCKYCGKSFKHKQSVSKHIKYSCPKNKDEDLHP
jgi:hypothetical protein